MTSLTVEAVDVDPFDSDEDEAPTGRSSYRDEFQVARDADVKVLFDSWKTGDSHPTWEQLTAKPGGKASPEFKASQKKIYIVKKAELPEVKRAIRRACLLYKPSDESGTLGGVPVYVADRKLEDGRYRIKFTWSPQPVKTPKTASDTPADPPANTPQDTSGDQETPSTGSQPPAPAAPPEPQRRGRFGGR